MTTHAPRRANAEAVASPIPLEPPVTTTTGSEGIWGMAGSFDAVRRGPAAEPAGALPPLRERYQRLSGWVRGADGRTYPDGGMSSPVGVRAPSARSGGGHAVDHEVVVCREPDRTLRDGDAAATARWAQDPHDLVRLRVHRGGQFSPGADPHRVVRDGGVGHRIDPRHGAVILVH